MLADDFPPGRWRGRWIWDSAPAIRFAGGVRPEPDPSAFDRYVLFRRAFVLNEVPERVPLRATADSRFVLWVNGVELVRGPVRSRPQQLHYELADAAPHLRPGENVVAALVRFYGHPCAWWVPAPTTYSLGAGCFVCEARLGEEWLVSDTSWRTRAGEAWTPQSPTGFAGALSEVHDARAMPAGWTQPGFDDSSWNPAVEIVAVHLGGQGRAEPPSDPYGPLLPRPIPPLDGEVRRSRPVAVVVLDGADDPGEPVAQVEFDETTPERERFTPDGFPLTVEPPADGTTHLTVDFGEVVAGTLSIDIEGAAGARLDLSAAEGLRPDGRLLRLEQYDGLRYTLRGTGDTFERFDPVGLRYARIAVRGGPVTFRSVTAKERLFPRPPGCGFACSDPLLTRIYEVGLRTVDLCAHDAFVDCPTREQRAWTGDAALVQHVHLVASPDWSLVRRHLALAGVPSPDGMLPMVAAGDFELGSGYIPDWALHWIRALRELWRYTGDEEFVATLLPAAEGVLRWFLPFRDGGLLHDVTGWVLVDWSDVPVAGCSAALNALWARALRDFAEVCDDLGDAHRTAWARGLHAEVAGAFERFWDAGRGLYVDHIVNGEVRRPVSQHTNAAGICAEIVPPERVDGVLERICDRSRLVRRSTFMEGLAAEDNEARTVVVRGLPDPDWDVETQILEAQPFFRYVVHDALAAAGHADRIAGACRDWKELLDAGETTWPETWHGGTHCHAWCATPTRDLVVYTLGIRPAEPGFTRALVAPRLGDLEWAEGTAPTPHGSLHVRVTSDAVEVSSPVPVDLDLDGEIEALAAGEHRRERRRT